jgi:hypothetical protein
MEFFFPEDNLDNFTRATPEETKITSLSAQPYPDGRRARVNMELTPFQKRPHIEITLTDANGAEVASTQFIEPMSWRMEFTLHIRGEICNPYALNAQLYYPDGPSAQPFVISFEMTPPEPDSN